MTFLVTSNWSTTEEYEETCKIKSTPVYTKTVTLIQGTSFKIALYLYVVAYKNESPYSCLYRI